jgi:hypothetical protein
MRASSSFPYVAAVGVGAQRAAAVLGRTGSAQLPGAHGSSHNSTSDDEGEADEDEQVRHTHTEA